MENNRQLCVIVAVFVVCSPQRFRRTFAMLLEEAVSFFVTIFYSD